MAAEIDNLLRVPERRDGQQGAEHDERTPNLTVVAVGWRVDVVRLHQHALVVVQHGPERAEDERDQAEAGRLGTVPADGGHRDRHHATLRVPPHLRRC